MSGQFEAPSGKGTRSGATSCPFSNSGVSSSSGRKGRRSPNEETVPATSVYEIGGMSSGSRRRIVSMLYFCGSHTLVGGRSTPWFSTAQERWMAGVWRCKKVWHSSGNSGSACRLRRTPTVSPGAAVSSLNNHHHSSFTCPDSSSPSVVGWPSTANASSPGGE